MDRLYDKDDPSDKAWQSKVYRTALEEIREHIARVDDPFTSRQINQIIKEKHPRLCDDEIKNPGSPAQPKWEHSVANALQSLKRREIEKSNGGWIRQGEFPSRTVQQRSGAEQSGSGPQLTVQATLGEEKPSDFRNRLLERVQAISPSEFERLIAKLLDGRGFVEVQVTGRPSDGGIDGHCEVALVGLNLAFQAKRYNSGTIVRAPSIRDFRGAIVGRQQDGGIFITTSSFTDEALMEAKEPGPKITLLNGEQFAEMMIHDGLGIKDIVVRADVDEDFFKDLKR